MTPSRGLIHGKAPPDRVPIIASMSRQSDQISSAANQGSRERGMVAIVAALARELHPQRSRFIEVGASSRIEQDLGIDSLARTELVLRIERAFRVRLSAQAIGEAETVHDLAQALDRALPAQRRIGVEAPAAALPAVPAATKALTLIDVLEWHVARHPDRTHLTVLQDEATALGTLTYGELAARARGVGRGLLMRDIVPEDRVAHVADRSRFFRRLPRRETPTEARRANAPSP